MPTNFSTIKQTESYGRLTTEQNEFQFARNFHLDELDQEFIGKSRTIMPSRSAIKLSKTGLPIFYDLIHIHAAY